MQNVICEVALEPFELVIQMDAMKDRIIYLSPKTNSFFGMQLKPLYKVQRMLLGFRVRFVTLMKISVLLYEVGFKWVEKRIFS